MGARCRMPARGRPGATKQSCNSSWRVEHDEEEPNSIDEELVALRFARDREKPLNCRRAEERTEERTGTADHQHRKSFERGIDASAFRGQHADVIGNQDPTHGGIRAANCKYLRLDLDHIDAEYLRSKFVMADQPQGAQKTATHEPRKTDQRKAETDNRQDVPLIARKIHRRFEHEARCSAGQSRKRTRQPLHDKGKA